MSENDEKLAQFQSITGCDQERAQFYLESANWQIDLAMASFYEGEGDMDADPAPVEAPQPTADMPTEAQPSVGGAGGMGRINFGGAAASDSDDSDSEQQAFFAGGSSHSGNVILGPKKKKFNVSDMFKAAREAGAEEVEQSGSGASGSGVKAFQGGGFKLGSDTAESVKVGGNELKRPEPRQFILKMWRDGFSLDDGDLRAYSDPNNREFLASVMKGSIPPELVKEAKGGEVHVDMEDHREEEFVKPKVRAKPFQGSGNVLGSIAPSVAPPAANPSLDPAQAESAAQEKVKLDSSQPVANIQVRLADGSRLVVKLNHNHTVADLRTYINTARPQYDGVEFLLLTTFPSKELTDSAATIASAGLVGAAVMQRLK